MSDITVQFGTPNISVYFPTNVAAQPVTDWIDALSVCDSDNTDSATGNSAQDAGVAIGGYYLTSVDHISAPGGIVKKRLI